LSNKNYNISLGLGIVKAKIPKVETIKFKSFKKLFPYLKNNIQEIDKTIDEYRELDDTNTVKTKIPYWSGFDSDGLRRKESFLSRSWFTGDLDYIPHNWREILSDALEGIYYITHTSLSHDPEIGKYKIRLIIPLDQSVSELTEFSRVSYYLMNIIQKEEHYFDIGVTKNPVTALFLPARFIDDENFLIEEHNEDCKAFKVDIALKANGMSTELLFSGEGIEENTTGQKRRDPATLDGAIGAFCSLYTARDVISKYGGDDYAPAPGGSGRWYYKKGTGTTAIQFYMDDKLLHSDHSTDPLNMNDANGHRQWNAFELYAFFVHGNNQVEAENALEHDAEVKALLNEEFNTIQSELQSFSEPTVGEYLDVVDFPHLLTIRDPSVIRYLKNKVGKVLLGNKSRMVMWRSVYSQKGKPPILEPFYFNLSELEKQFSHIQEVPLPGRRGTFNVMRALDLCMPSSNIYGGEDFDPAPPGEEIPVTVNGNLNSFRGFPVQPYENGSANPAYVEPEAFIYYIREILCCNNDEKFVWVMDWVAQIFQEPASKTNTCLALVSEAKGTGKSTLIEKIFDKLLGNMSIMVDGDSITDKFNSYIARKMIVGIDDLDGHAKSNAGKLRNQVTKDSVKIEPKGVDAYVTQNFARLVVTSNNHRFLDVGFNKGQDRRFTILEVSENHQQDISYWTDFNNWIEKQDSLKAIMTYLMERRIVSNLTTALVTDTLKDMGLDSMNPYEELLSELIDDLRFLYPDGLDGLTEKQIKSRMVEEPPHFITYKKDGYFYFDKQEIMRDLMEKRSYFKKTHLWKDVRKVGHIHGCSISIGDDGRGIRVRTSDNNIRAIGIKLMPEG